jgi:hypothetical protein
MIGSVLKTMIALTLLVLLGCATIRTTPVRNLSDPPEGVRVYPPKIYLLVDNEQHQSTIALLPDYEHAYDIRPLTVFAKNNVSIETDDGQIKKFSDDQDTSGFLTFLYQAGQAAARGAGLPVSTQVIKGTFGLPDGIYTIGERGAFVSAR